MITGSIAVDDYLAAQRLHRRLKVRRHFIFGVAAIAIGILLLIFSDYLDDLLSYLIIAGGLGAFLGEAINAWYIPRRTRKLHAQQKELHGTFTYSWDAQGLEANSVAGHTRRDWSIYHNVREDDHVVLLYHNDNLFEMIPKRWFADGAVLEQFRRAILNVKKT
jgi:hypothetical protein